MMMRWSTDTSFCQYSSGTGRTERGGHRTQPTNLLATQRVRVPTELPFLHATALVVGSHISTHWKKKKKIIISQLPTSTSASASASATSRLPHRSPSYALLPNHQRRHAKTEDNQKFPAPASSGGKSAKSACVVACWVGCGGERGWRRRGRGSNILTFLLHYYSLLSVCVCVCRNSIIEDADGVWKSNSIFFFSINEKKRSLSLSLCHTKASMTCVHEFLVLKKLKIRVFFGQFSLN